jgi:hypothetical protein
MRGGRRHAAQLLVDKESENKLICNSHSPVRTLTELICPTFG